MIATFFTVGEAADLLSEPGFNARQAAARLMNLIGRKDRDAYCLFNSYGHVRETGAPVREYPFAEVCAAKVLFALIEQGIADRDVLWAAYLGLSHHYSRASDVPAKLPKDTPFQRAIKNVETGGCPLFALTTWRHDQTGERDIVGEVRFEGEKGRPGPLSIEAIRDPKQPSAFIPRSFTAVYLNPLLLPLIRKNARKARMN